jgi:hypothetical protein
MLLGLAVATGLSLPLPASAQQADVTELLACRRLTSSAERWACLDRSSAAIAEALAPPLARASVAPPSRRASGAALGRPTVRDAAPDLALGTLPVKAVSYEDGKPVLLLANGELWVSEVVRHLTLRGDGDFADVRRSPVGYLLHFNGSRFALPVSRR